MADIFGTTGNDSLPGTAEADVIEGLAGNDTLEGFDGDDTLEAGPGQDRLIAGAGDDVLDSSAGSPDEEGFGDVLSPGRGNDTIIGNAALWAAGGGVDFGYDQVSGVGGLTITADASGSGTVVSGDGSKNDTFTFANFIWGSRDSDIITSAVTDRFFGFEGGQGNDTLTGSGSQDEAQYYFPNGGQGIVADLEAGTVIDTFGDMDELIGIEWLRGSRADDSIAGDGNDNILRGEEGDDTISDGLGDDVVEGGDGNDIFISQGGNDTFDGGAGTDILQIPLDASIYPDDLVVEVDLAVGESGGVGVTANRDVLIGIDGVEIIGGVAVILTGDDGDNRLQAGTGNDTVNGGDGDDGILGDLGDDVLSGGAGDDNVAAGGGDDTVHGEAGDDFLGGGEGDDSMTGGAGDDTLGAGFGDDTVQGNAGNDVVAGGAGNDDIEGGAGNDTMGASFGTDTVLGGEGDDSLGGGTGRDLLSGDAGNDFLGGGEGDDTVEGEDGNDFLAGGGRNDEIDGGSGDDTINGGDGNDRLEGDDGADVFVWTSGEAGAVDLIQFFEDGVDQIRLTGVENAPGSGLQGRVQALDITDVVIDEPGGPVNGASLSYQGQTILITGVVAADLGIEDFIFL